MDKFNEVYLKIINECNETKKQNEIIQESLLRKVGGLFKGKAGKNKMMKEAIIGWMNANKFQENGAENKFSGKLPNGFEIKFTFRDSQWKDPKSTEIDYAVFLYNNDGQKLSLVDNKGTITYSYSEKEIKYELTKKLKVAIDSKSAKYSFTTKKAVDKAEIKAQKQADKQAKKEAAEKKAAEEKQKAEEARKAQAEKDAVELSE